jgi:hypothetical protein
VVVALGAGVKLIVKRPLHTLALGAAATVVALVVAAVLLVVRHQLAQASAAGILLAFILAQLAVAAIAWGHAAKLAGLVEIARELVASGTGGTIVVPDVPSPDPDDAAVPPADVLVDALAGARSRAAADEPDQRGDAAGPR